MNELNGQGKALERYLETLHANYRRQGLAHIVKVPTPVCITGNVRGKITGHLEPPVYVDFTGVIAGGTAIALEAKYTQHDGRSFPLSKIRPGQRDVMSSVHLLGGVSAVFCRHHGRQSPRSPQTNRDYLIPAAYIDSLERKSWRWDAIERYQIPAGKTWINAVSIVDTDTCSDSERAMASWTWYVMHGWI